jgi:hypothetical protein
MSVDQRATGDLYANQEARAHAWHRPDTGGTCPRSVAGLRCRNRTGDPCICTRRTLDHPRRWRHTDRHTVLTAEPYGVDGRDLAELVTDLGRAWASPRHRAGRTTDAARVAACRPRRTRGAIPPPPRTFRPPAEAKSRLLTTSAPSRRAER